MSRVHLGHKIPWQDFIECCRVADPSSITLPIGECSRIHIIDKSTKIKIENRNYINKEDICESKTCKIIGNKTFSKGKTVEIDLYSKSRNNASEDIKKKFIYFSKKLVDAVFEFGDTEASKEDPNPKKLLNQNLETYSVDFYKKINLDRYFIYDSKNNKIVLALFLECDLKNLLNLHSSKEINISEAFGTYYGGQAVGRSYIFLIEGRLIPFYLASNAIIAAGYQNDKSKWGKLSPENHFFNQLLHDCDFLTFIPSLRHYLAEDIFMVDLEKTDQLLKEIFKYIYVYISLCRRVTNTSYDEILGLFQDIICRTFRLNKLKFYFCTCNEQCSIYFIC